MKEIFNYTNLIIEGDSIEIMVDGIVVSGRITLRNKRNIAVEITSPYEGVSESSGCITLLGLQVHNFLGKTGDEKAATLLLAIYKFCAFVDDHKDRLLAALGTTNTRRLTSSISVRKPTKGISARLRCCRNFKPL